MATFQLPDTYSVQETINSTNKNGMCFPTLQQIAQLLPMDTKVILSPEQRMATYPKSFNPPSSESSEAVSENTQSSDGASSSVSSSKGRNERRPTISSRRRQVDARQDPSHNANLIFAPRPYESVCAERAYLTSSLLLQSARAADLMRQYSLAEAGHQGLGAGKERRRLRKHLRLLQPKMIEVAEQQRAICNRLGELYAEIQSREALTLPGYQGPSFMNDQVPESPSVYSAMSPYGISTPQSMPLSPTSPVFVPQGYLKDFPFPTDPPSSQQEPTDAGRLLETVVEEGEEVVRNLEFSSELSCESGDEEVVMDTDDMDFDSTSWCASGSGATRSRRHSLPYIQTAWPET
ncbi:hypothetical protein B0J13DRAFT_113862 [Dactylonectria estremocensis]|uniref:Uncharacterized protein n=1 Tax=Dactylonectria estremocensis TaxID=1079267 RepID=A0A9P9FBC6_9HYPO|nr:hypothetical protein B0J13DRAFT_113862 [Dactylonectria estremocensis]